MVAGVTQVIKVLMLPNERQAAALADTLRTCNSAASWLSGRMHAERVRRKYDAHKRFHTELKRAVWARGAAGNPGDRQSCRGLCRAAGQYRSRQLRATRLKEAKGCLGQAYPFPP